MKTWLSLLGVCVLLGGLLSGTHLLTKPNIQANRSAAQRAVLTALVAPQQLPEELDWQQGYLAICRQLTLESLVVTGYGGPITLLIAYQRQTCATSSSQCSLPRLRQLVISDHSETPGIGDFFETTHPNWLKQLRNQSAQDPEIDSISGATITATALGNAVAAALNVGSAIPFAENACAPPVAAEIHQPSADTP